MTGKFVVTALAMLVLTFIMDFDTITLSTDNVRPSKTPETWKINGLIAVALVAGTVMVVESLLLLWFGWTRFGLSHNPAALCSFSFLLLHYYTTFSTLSSRDRQAFWASTPSLPLRVSLSIVAVIGTILTCIGLPGLPTLPWPVILTLFLTAIFSCLVVNDRLKVILIRKLLPAMRAELTN